jgi:hypothetical protein
MSFCRPWTALRSIAGVPGLEDELVKGIVEFS